MYKWTPTQEQQSGCISRTFDFFIDELTELQDELDCPDEFISNFLEILKNRWAADSCHSKQRLHKRNHPEDY